MTEDALQALLIECLETVRETGLPELRRLLRADLPRERLAGLLLSLEQQGRVLLTPHAQPEMLTFSERQQCISTPRGLLYLVRLPSTGAGD